MVPFLHDSKAAGLCDLEDTSASCIAGMSHTAQLSPSQRFRPPVEVSELAEYVLTSQREVGPVAQRFHEAVSVDVYFDSSYVKMIYRMHTLYPRTALEQHKTIDFSKRPVLWNRSRLSSPQATRFGTMGASARVEPRPADTQRGRSRELVSENG